MDKLIHPYNELRKRYDHIQDRFIDLFREMLAEIEAKDEEIAALKSSIEPACSTAKNSFDAAKKAYIELTNNVAFSESGNAVYVADQSVMNALDKYFGSR